ncbi:hypothetical protein VTK73DRAFT_3360 [Phialemonium thermophilum]|uniref:Uncharacterized protein n=1 Tax=Phialemonium thermophilum TaxID=223376 RepID=A0ABR3VJ28_9PEZI
MIDHVPTCYYALRVWAICPFGEDHPCHGVSLQTGRDDSVRVRHRRHLGCPDKQGPEGPQSHLPRSENGCVGFDTSGLGSLEPLRTGRSITFLCRAAQNRDEMPRRQRRARRSRKQEKHATCHVLLRHSRGLPNVTVPRASPSVRIYRANGSRLRRLRHLM